MSDTSDMLFELLPKHSKLNDSNNPFRKIITNTICEWLENFNQPYEQLFITTATGGWLDAHGKDYGVPRRIDEDDDSYRQRIIYEKLDHLTPALLGDVYGVKLFTYRGDFNASDNTLVSDNPHIVQSDSFLGLSDEDTISILDKKFVLDSIVTWINDTGEIEYILDTHGKNILSNYSKIYTLNDVSNYCSNNATIQQVKLELPNAINCNNLFNICSALLLVELNLPNCTSAQGMFSYCSALTEIELDLPSVTNCGGMFANCSGLKNVKLNLPNLVQYSSMFGGTGNIETIDVTIPTSIKDGFKTMVLSATPRLTHLTSFKINGEEQL